MTKSRVEEGRILRSLLLRKYYISYIVTDETMDRIEVVDELEVITIEYPISITQPWSIADHMGNNFFVNFIWVSENPDSSYLIVTSVTGCVTVGGSVLESTNIWNVDGAQIGMYRLHTLLPIWVMVVRYFNLFKKQIHSVMVKM